MRESHHLKLMALLLSAVLLFGTETVAKDQLIKAAVVKVERDTPLPISRLDLPIDDDAFGGGRQATRDNATTGAFLGQKYETLEVTVQPEELTARLDELLSDGVRFLVSTGTAADLLAIAD
ncbi:MAG: branched-chain amino acid ABC transporter substrate-binding protein, partial [Pseudomonadota bacterium]